MIPGMGDGVEPLQPGLPQATETVPALAVEISPGSFDGSGEGYVDAEGVSPRGTGHEGLPEPEPEPEKLEPLSLAAFSEGLRKLGSPLGCGPEVAADLATGSNFNAWAAESGNHNFLDLEALTKALQDGTEAEAQKHSQRLKAALRHFETPRAALAALGGSILPRLEALRRARVEAEETYTSAEDYFNQEAQNPTLSFSNSSGGLVTALEGVGTATAGLDLGANRDMDLVWIGWPGPMPAKTQNDPYRQGRVAEVMRNTLKPSCVPIFLTPEDVEGYYKGFSNSSLWPLLHWMTPKAGFNIHWWEAYKRVNEMFANRIVDTAQDGDLVWIHDYHLMLVPNLVRAKLKDRGYDRVKVAFFLHVPFPSCEIIGCLPQSRELMLGVLGADLIGFHTYGYLRHFRGALLRTTGYASEMDYVDADGYRSRLGVFPIGVSKDKILSTLESEDFRRELDKLGKEFENKALVLSVERLDYSKGIPEKLAAIRRFLDLTKESRDANASAGEAEGDDQDGADLEIEPNILQRISQGLSRVLPFGKSKEKRAITFTPENTVFLFITVPSRTELDEYRQIEDEVQRTISEINGAHSTTSNVPIIYIHRAVPFPELVALYARADLCLVTPLMDGMNLVAKEFVVAKDKSIHGVMPGPVVLSERAGAAQEMFDAIVVNPYDVDATARAIVLGLEIREKEKWTIVEPMRTVPPYFCSAAKPCAFLVLHAVCQSRPYILIVDPCAYLSPSCHGRFPSLTTRYYHTPGPHAG